MDARVQTAEPRNLFPQEKPTAAHVSEGKPQRPRVVIVGAGFGGLEAAMGLAQAPVEVALVDSKNHHCFQPLLYQAATAALTSADIGWPIRHVLRRQGNVVVLMQTARGVDPARQVLLVEDGEIPYDWLVLATGAAYSYFGHEEWAWSAPGLKTIEDAALIRSEVLTAFERAETATDTGERARLLTFVVVGGGPTGVELAGALAELAHGALASEFRRSNPRKARILLLEAGPRLLASFPERLSDYARRALEARGVETRTGAKVEALGPDFVVAAGERIEAGGIILWAAGVRASPAADWLGAPKDASGRVLVEADLSAPSLPNVFVIGDAAAALGPDGRPAPGLAPAAKQMGRYVARRIRAAVAGRAAPAAFRYRDAGNLATIGRNAAVVKLKGLELTGFPAWLFWSVVHIYFLIGLRSRLLVAASWAWSYATLQRGARLITRS